MKDWAIRSVTSYGRLYIKKADYGGHSETERVLVDNEGLAILSLLKIQSGPLGNLGDQPFDGDEFTYAAGPGVRGGIKKFGSGAISDSKSGK